MRRIAATSAGLLLAACVPGEAAPPRITIEPPQHVLRIGQSWQASVEARGERPRTFVIRRGNRLRRFPLVRSGRLYRASVVFPAAGRWRYGVGVRGRDVLVGSVVVRRARPVLREPFGIVEEPRGTLLVADFRANAILRLVPRRGEGLLLARVHGPRDLRSDGRGAILVSSGSTVLALDPANGRTRVVARASGELEGVAPGPGGSIYAVEEQSRIVQLDSAGRRTVLADGLNGVHGIAVSPAGLVLCESYAGNVRLLEPDGRLRVLAGGLGNPSAAVRAAEGIYVTEFAAGRVGLLESSGVLRQVATVRSPGPIALDSQGRLLVGSLDGRISRVDPRSGRVTRLWPPPQATTR